MHEGKTQLRIPVVEDEAKVARSLREGLEREKYEVVVALTGEEDNAEKRSRPRHHVSNLSAAREIFCYKSVKRRVAMKIVWEILAGVAALSGVIMMILESNEGRSSSYASQPETPAPQQSAGASFTYNFDGDAVGAMPPKFHGARTGKGAEGKWVVMADPSAASKPNVVAQISTDTTLSLPTSDFRRRKLQGLGVEREVQSRCRRSGPSGGPGLSAEGRKQLLHRPRQRAGG